MKLKYINHKVIHKTELKLNSIKYNGIELGNLISCYLDIFYVNKFNISWIKKILFFIYYLIKPFSKKKIFKNKNKKFIYFCSGPFRHMKELKKTILERKNIKNQTLVVSLKNLNGLDEKVFYLSNVNDYLKTLIFLFKNFKAIEKILKPNNFFLFEKIIFFIELHMQLLKANSLRNFILSQPQTKLIGSDFDRGYESALFFAVAKSLKIESFVFQHGALNPPFGFYPVNADEYWAWGEMSKKQLIKFGVSSKKIHIVGTPIVQDVKPHKIISKQIKIKKRKNIILALSTNIKSKNLKMVKFFSNIKKFNSDLSYDYYVKIYPSLSVNECYWIKNTYNIDILPPTLSFDNFINTTDILLTDSSSVANEALYYKKKIGIIDIYPSIQHNGKELNKYLKVPLIKKLIKLDKMKYFKNFNNKNFLYYKIGIEAKIEIQNRIEKKLDLKL